MEESWPYQETQISRKNRSISVQYTKWFIDPQEQKFFSVFGITLEIGYMTQVRGIQCQFFEEWG
jgi:hypothetical protein